MMRELLDKIIGHLRVAQMQRTQSDDRIIAGHIDEAFALAKILRDMMKKK